MMRSAHLLPRTLRRVEVLAAPLIALLIACGSSNTADRESATAEPDAGGATADVAAGASGDVSTPRGDCSSETGLAGRGDILLCEGWERADWWRQGYLRSASTTRSTPVAAGDVDRTSVVKEGCISGSCLKVEMRKWEAGAVAIHWPMAAAGKRPENVYLRYYIKLAPDFSPNLCTPGGALAGSGGKFPGLADVDVYPDQQCGNGGYGGDGINCWSMRSLFRDCLVGESSHRHACVSPKATTRFGSYLYLPKASQEFANWDQEQWGAGTIGGACGSDPDSIGNCGIGNNGQFENDRWYQVEMQVKMNTPGAADGVLRGWVDGKLSYQKTNMVWRYPGHDNLHVRTVWLNVHAGGEFMGLCQTSYIMMDQMVVATDAPIGGLGAAASSQRPGSTKNRQPNSSPAPTEQR